MLPPPPYSIHDQAELAPLVARIIQQVSQRAIARRGVAHIALSGGTTPRTLFRLLATDPWRRSLDWAHIHLWWVDERCVPVDDPASNYGVCYSLLLAHLQHFIAHRMPAEVAPPAQAAARYEAELRKVFGLGPYARPRFDLILLGMGPDGHTASLFPHTPALQERKALVTVGQAPQASRSPCPCSRARPMPCSWSPAPTKARPSQASSIPCPQPRRSRPPWCVRPVVACTGC